MPQQIRHLPKLTAQDANPHHIALQELTDAILSELQSGIAWT